MITVLQTQEPAPGVTLLLRDRPEVRNAVDEKLLESLRRGMSAPAAVVLASSTPGMFCAGADLNIPDEHRRHLSDGLYALYEQMLSLQVPIIAAVDGAAVGGGAQLALATDVRLASSHARFRFAGPGHGLSVGAWALPSTVGRRALELMLGQRFIAAGEALDLGLVDRIVEDPVADAIALARRVSALDAAAVARAKAHVACGERLFDRLAAERAGNVASFTGAVPSTTAADRRIRE
jgi:enoyl-CoA hydratase/carnithine racemase